MPERETTRSGCHTSMQWSSRACGAARVTAVVPYLAYARKDRRTAARDPVTTRYVAALFEAMGVATGTSMAPCL